ncbi:MAG: hypothetical protein H6602_11015 [Flavobacteriales bacterium]|nr:hypothetical protein [Flavobacteriales bacterium]
MWRWIILLTVLSVAMGCQQQECKKPATGKPINPNGDSELALLMREMFEESDSLKQIVIDGKELSGLNKYQEIHSAIPTDSTVRGPVFDAFAQNYIASIKALEASDSASIFNFNHMVDQCMNCHTEFCPGPKKRIKKLYIR